MQDELTLVAAKYCESGEVPTVGAYVLLSGPIWLSKGSDGSIEADSLEIVTNNINAGLKLPLPLVYVIGTVATVKGRDIYMDVGAYSRDARSVVTYKVIVTVPDNCRRANMRMPQTGSNISVCGILSDIAVHGDVESIELENLINPCLKGA
ncbi:unnamed protein product [Rhizoctonia solani]|uniref:Uncharacterized protein n=1 Tax=Rhizoctonia solani TaxID=456999 RepID=A0A8H3CDF0_9AGAM|nr:unnamed protein product [Rhizoctonia solani]CAE6481660.1 unnamed protein product [Rhizoctonia solani]